MVFGTFDIFYIGIDRLFIALMNQESIRDTVLFPAISPRL